MSNTLKFFGIKKIDCYGNDINTYDIAKFLAITFMVIDHLGNFFFPETYWLRGLGRIAFPIFFFLIGYSKYFATSWNLLIIGAALSIYKGLMLDQWYPLDILVSAFVARFMMSFFEKKNLLSDANLLVILFGLVLWHVGLMFVLGYGTLGIMFAICGYIKRLEVDGNPQKFLPAMLLAIILIDFVMQNLVWDKAINYIDIFSVVSVCLVYYFMAFEMKIVSISNQLAKNIIMFASRNSLFIYWLHFIIFVTIAAKLGSFNH